MYPVTSSELRKGKEREDERDYKFVACDDCLGECSFQCKTCKGKGRIKVER